MKKIIEFKSNSSKEKNKISKKKLAIIISIMVLIIIIIITSIIYCNNKNFQNFMDRYIFLKNITDENIPVIEFDYDSNTNVIPYGRYICILAENNLSMYNSNGKKEQEVKVEISDPIYNVNARYLVIGGKENNQAQIYYGKKN